MRSVISAPEEILADTRGYTSRDWTKILFVIYETNRFKTGKDWDQQLRESAVPENISVVVLSGEPLERKRVGVVRKQKNLKRPQMLCAD